MYCFTAVFQGNTICLSRCKDTNVLSTIFIQTMTLPLCILIGSHIHSSLLDADSSKGIKERGLD